MPGKGDLEQLLGNDKTVIDAGNKLAEANQKFLDAKAAGGEAKAELEALADATFRWDFVVRKAGEALIAGGKTLPAEFGTAFAASAALTASLAKTSETLTKAHVMDMFDKGEPPMEMAEAMAKLFYPGYESLSEKDYKENPPQKPVPPEVKAFMEELDDLRKKREEAYRALRAEYGFSTAVDAGFSALDTGHYDDGHGFGWQKAKEPAPSGSLWQDLFEGKAPDIDDVDPSALPSPAEPQPEEYEVASAAGTSPDYGPAHAIIGMPGASMGENEPDSGLGKATWPSPDEGPAHAILRGPGGDDEKKERARPLVLILGAGTAIAIAAVSLTLLLGGGSDDGSATANGEVVLEESGSGTSAQPASGGGSPASGGVVTNPPVEVVPQTVEQPSTSSSQTGNQAAAQPSTGSQPAPQPQPAAPPTQGALSGDYSVLFEEYQNVGKHPAVLVGTRPVSVLITRDRASEPNPVSIEMALMPATLLGKTQIGPTFGSPGGSFTANAMNAYQGYQTTWVFEGTIYATDGLSGLLTIGGDRRLPGGQPIVYKLSGRRR